MRIEISKNLILFIKAKDMTQKELATKIGVKPQAVNNWCKGIREPSAEMLIALCKALDCTPNDLLGWDEMTI